jgi:hypothetical protein
VAEEGLGRRLAAALGIAWGSPLRGFRENGAFFLTCKIDEDARKSLMAVMIPVEKIARICNPYRSRAWGVEVTLHQVRWAIKMGFIAKDPVEEAYFLHVENHAARIAFFVKNESDDPIEIDVGVPALGCHVEWIVTDGNHRLAAAIYARRAFIKASVGGDLNYARKLLGVDCEERDQK